MACTEDMFVCTQTSRYVQVDTCLQTSAFSDKISQVVIHNVSRLKKRKTFGIHPESMENRTFLGRLDEMLGHFCLL